MVVPRREPPWAGSQLHQTSLGIAQHAKGRDEHHAQPFGPLAQRAVGAILAAIEKRQPAGNPAERIPAHFVEQQPRNPIGPVRELAKQHHPSDTGATQPLDRLVEA